jgi:hypothetical protein
LPDYKPLLENLHYILDVLSEFKTLRHPARLGHFTPKGHAGVLQALLKEKNRPGTIVAQ